MKHLALTASGLLLAAACQPAESMDSIRTSLITEGSKDAHLVLDFVNDEATTQTLLDDDVGLDARAARNIIAHRNGPDATFPSGDDDLFDSIAELDAISYVGNKALEALLAYAQSLEDDDGEPVTDPVLLLVNDPVIDVDTLDFDVGLDGRAARNIIAHRQGPDAVDETDDDNLFDSIEELDAIPYVGATALRKLREYADAMGYGQPATSASVIFSPQSYNNSHNVRVAELIAEAQHSLDIAMYSYSDAGIGSALSAAVARGVDVRFIFETANDDRKEDAADQPNTKSGRLEAMGIDVRYVNKIMHHKFMIVDGPRDDLSRAQTATLVTGSGNWSYGAATRYDENTVFLTGHEELNLRFQKEFNLLWEHSRDFASIPYDHVLSTALIEDIDDEPDMHAEFTSDNFSVSGNTFRIVTGRDTISDALVDAIESATTSIWVASGHLRSRPISEALMNKAINDPAVEILVYLDGQEYISAWYHNEQVRELNDCLDNANTPSQTRRCMDRGFYFGYQLGQHGIDVRYKTYSYRWHYSYAVQMHHKYILIDGDELWTGSYNLSDNAEHNTFENMVQLTGASFEDLVDAFEGNFSSIWETRRAGTTYDDLVDEIETADTIPLVFDSMALDWQEVTDLKQAIRDNCSLINSEPYRTEPERNRSCPATLKARD